MKELPPTPSSRQKCVIRKYKLDFSNLFFSPENDQNNFNAKEKIINNLLVFRSLFVVELIRNFNVLLDKIVVSPDNDQNNFNAEEKIIYNLLVFRSLSVVELISIFNVSLEKKLFLAPKTTKTTSTTRKKISTTCKFFEVYLMSIWLGISMFYLTTCRFFEFYL